MYAKNLAVLKALMKVAEEPKSTFIFMEKIEDMIEAMTIMKSKAFPLSEKYLLTPRAIILMIASMT